MHGDGPMNEEMRQYDPPAREKRKDTLISLFYVAVLVLCGLPMWVATTTTYRASLPEADMARLATAVLDITVEINLIDMTSELGPAGLREVREGLLKELEQLAKPERQVRLHYIVGAMREASRVEAMLLNRAKTIGEFQTLLLEVENSREPNGGIRVLLLPEETSLLAHDKDVLIARGPTNVPLGDPLSFVLVRTRSASHATRALTVTIGRVLASQERLQHAYQAVLEVPVKSSLAAEVSKRVRSLLTRVHSASRYEWVFSLIVPQPQPFPAMSDEAATTGDERSPEWDFPRWEHLYLEPLVRQLGAFVAVRVSSQLVYGVRPPPPTGAPRGSSRDNDRLTRLVNGLEAYLGGASPSQLHMVVVAPTCRTTSTSPLATVTASQQQRQEAFTVPGWGAVLLLGTRENSSSPACSLQLPVDGTVAMPELLPRLLALMGLSGEQLESISGELLTTTGLALDYERADDQAGMPLAGWQMQSWLRERTVENLAVTRATLRSLLVLLDRVVTMVIRDEVASHVRTATERGLIAMEALQKGALAQAFLASRQALQAAETAFFHPSLLELLYFQDDQKIGIYIPLFVPILVPLILGAAKALWPMLATSMRRPVHAKRD